MRYSIELGANDLSGSVSQNVVQRLARHEGVHELAVEGLCQPSESLQCNRSICFILLHILYGLRSFDAQSLGELRTAHPKSFPYRSNPAPFWPREPRQVAIGGQSAIKLLKSQEVFISHVKLTQCPPGPPMIRPNARL